jgi:O2-independent ubiquinone biosynthesis protein UbiV
VALMELVLGPLLFNWPAERVERFYAEIADKSPFSRVYLGEVVCSKRMPFLEPALVRSAERLTTAGKSVVWSTLALPATEREQKLTLELADFDGEIEINDMSAVYARLGRAFTAGPYLNIYNEAALAEMVSFGCVRLCPNIELSLKAIAQLHKAAENLPIELFAFGRLPLALSGRCYHARAEGLHKDACQFVCDRNPDGRTITTVEGADFLAMNGVQTLSHGMHISAVQLPSLEAAGVTALRLSPHSVDMVAVANLFSDFACGRIEGHELHSRLAGIGLPGPLINGYLFGAPGHMAMPA